MLKRKSVTNKQNSVDLNVEKNTSIIMFNNYVVLAYLLISISVSSIVGIFYIAYYCFFIFFAHCTWFLHFD